MPTAVLVHGAWHGAWCWEGVVAALEGRGVDAVTVELPFTGVADDIATARAAIADAGEGCVVVGHSYGGVVITGAAVGLPVRRLVYLCAFMVEPGAAIAGAPLLMEAIRSDDSGVWIDPDMAPAVFYADAPPEVVAATLPRLRPMDIGPTQPPDAGAAWRDVPSTYVVCTEDRAIPVAAQRRMAANAAHVVEWPTDHSPFLSHPELVADLICGAFS